MSEEEYERFQDLGEEIRRRLGNEPPYIVLSDRENDQMNRPRGGSSLQWRAAPRRFVIE